MCGFVGWINIDTKQNIDPTVLRVMNNTLSHRGPDDDGYFIQANVGIAHRRLSIIDTSSVGRQPIFNEDRSALVVLNGEIYNFPELRQILTNEGHAFTTHTDTEVIVHAYEKWGVDFLKQLDGMFSLALFDIRNHKLILAKDPFGKKPLYYTLQKGAFLFASELKAFSKNPHFEKSLDMSALSMYLAYEYVPTPYCIFKGCLKLPRASYLLVDTQNLQFLPKPQKYWELKYQPKLKISEKEAVEELLRLLKLSVQKRLVSDVPLGVFLSGGIDSSSIVAMMAELLPANMIKTFNIGFRESSFDESSYSRVVSNNFATNHYESILDSKNMLDIFPKIINQLDEPFADASIIPTYLLCGFARQYVTVALGGDGGDELFAGYDPFLAQKFSFLLELCPIFLLNGARDIVSYLPVSNKNMSLDFKIKHFLKGFTAYTRNNLELRNTVWLGSFTPDVQNLILNQNRLSYHYDSVYAPTFVYKQESRATNTIDRMIDNFINLYLHDDILVKVDRASMMHSLEVRAPFLDKNFSQFASRLPTNMKMKGFNRKYILKKSMTNRLPDCILRRPKKGFGVPLAKWFRGPLKDMLLDTFVLRGKNSTIFNSQFVHRLIRDHLSNNKDNRKEIWTMFTFELWRNYHAVSI